MPEGHTIHRLARDLNRDLRGRPLNAWSPQGRFADGAALIDGCAPGRAEAFGKHLFVRFDGDQNLHVHLGLIGKLLRRPAPVPAPVGEVRLRLVGAEAAWDLSGPAVCAIVHGEDMQRTIARLGPDPLRRDADPTHFINRVLRSDRAIGALLLDQGVVAGIGNVYRAEVLFLHGIHPETPGRALSEVQLAALWDELVAQLRDGVRRNRIVTVRPDERSRSVSRLRGDEVVYAYHQTTCRRCGSSIERLEVAGRRIDVCTTCQPRV